ncbi:MAG: hypothetical protein ACFBRM_04540 [Pikeienuella sp.]
MHPLYEVKIEHTPPATKSTANPKTSFHDRLAEAELSLGQFLFYHMVDAVGLVHALILRAQALLLPVQTLVLSGHH